MEITARRLRSMTDKTLVSRVKKGFQRIKSELPYILELRRRFDDRPRSKANIDGCKTWTEFCARRLNRTDRAIRHALAEARAETNTITVHVGKEKLPAVRTLVHYQPQVVAQADPCVIVPVDEHVNGKQIHDDDGGEKDELSPEARAEIESIAAQDDAERLMRMLWETGTEISNFMVAHEDHETWPDELLRAAHACRASVDELLGHQQLLGASVNS